MSINGRKEHNRILNKRKSNSLDRNNFEYFFPYEKSRNRTIEYEDKSYFKPRIIKHRNMNNSTENNDFRYKNINNDFTRNYNNKANRAYSTHTINVNSSHNIIPRIVRNKKNIRKYVNKSNNLENFKNDNQINNYQNNNIERKNNKYNNNYIQDSYFLNNYKNHFINGENYENQKNNKKINRTSSYDNISIINKNNASLLCRNCFDQKMLEGSQFNKGVDKIEYLNNKFINENPFYFIDKMSDNEKKRINDKIESNSNKQRLALSNYRKEIDNPKNNTKEKLQLINEYSLNPLAIEVGKDPRYVKQKQNFDKKEKMIQQNPDKYKANELRKAYKDYYNKCIYQIPKIEEIYHVNSVYKDNYIKALKKQIEDKKNKEYNDKKNQKQAEAYANKRFNEYKKIANLNEERKRNYERELLKNDNKQLDDFKQYKNNVLKEKEKKFGIERAKCNIQVDNDINLRNKNEKFDNFKIYKNWLNDANKKYQEKKDLKDEENKRWNNYIDNYNLKLKLDELCSCDICNRPYRKENLKKYPPPSTESKDYYINKLKNY